MKNRIQFDSDIRIVSISNLQMMCAKIDIGYAYGFKIVQINKNNVVVGYSCPDSSGFPHPVFATFPSYITFGENRLVILDIIKIKNSPFWKKQGWTEEDIEQEFEILQTYSKLWRNPSENIQEMPEEEWLNKKEWLICLAFQSL